jgi:hypothetical protein
MKHACLALLQILTIVYVAGNAFFLATYYADDIDGLVYATATKVEDFASRLGSGIDTAAAYLSTDDPDLITVNIVEGWRKEQIAEAFQEKLGWTDEERYAFAEMLQCAFETSEGKLFPTLYVVPKRFSTRRCERTHAKCLCGESINISLCYRQHIAT